MNTENKTDFSKYSREELIDSFERVDDEKYPENALEIYRLLRSKTKSEADLVDDRYTDGSGLLKTIAGLIFLPFFTDTKPTRSEMLEKLSRVQALEATEET